jgi:hypothetical protein
MKNGYLTWLAATVVGVVSMLVIERAFRLQQTNEIVPLAQAVGLWLAWVVAWPYMRTHMLKPDAKFQWYALSMFAASAFIASLRIVLKTG